MKIFRPFGRIAKVSKDTHAYAYHARISRHFTENFKSPTNPIRNAGNVEESEWKLVRGKLKREMRKLLLYLLNDKYVLILCAVARVLAFCN